MRLNIRLCITVALFAAVQPATASEFNQVIEDFDRYIQTEKHQAIFRYQCSNLAGLPKPGLHRR